MIGERGATSQATLPYAWMKYGYPLVAAYIAVERFVVEVGVLVPRRQPQRGVGSSAIEPIDAVIAEQSLRVGLARRENDRQMRQARADEYER